MARVTQVFSQIPWTGGLNDSVDSGLIPANDLVQADNVQFATNGSRLKREGLTYIDKELPSVVKRSSTGTTRSLVFDEAVTAASNNFFHVGEKITVSGVNVDYNGNQVVTAITTTDIANDTITYTASGSLSETAVSSTATVARNYNIIGLHDYWYFDSGNNIKQQQLVAVSSEGQMYRFDSNGNRIYIAKDAGATANAVTPIERCDIITFNNKCIVTLEGTGNLPRFYDGMSTDEWFDLPGAPDGAFMREHIGRIFMNDKADKDYLHFSETFDETVWLGLGDSGALYVGIEDGDPKGITGIAPPFKGILLISKGEKIVKLVGDAPETFQLVPMTSGLGGINHKAMVAVDFDDVYFLSRRGFHSAVATDTAGDFEANFLSRKIQNEFNTWNKANLDMTQGVYIETLNSVAWAVTEDGETGPSAIWLYNPTINEGEWFRWPGIAAYALSKRLAANEVRMIIGTDAGRILQAQNNTYADNGGSYTFRIKTGTIYPDGNPQTIKGFKRFSLLFRQRGRFSFQVIFRVDNQAPQAFTFEQTIDGDDLGTEFVLGSSILGSETIMAPVTKQVLGYGRGCTIEVAQTGPESQVELYGYMIEYKDVSLADEVKDGN
jgi:hypothetical protein